jgi:hypothetical protein
MARSTHSNKRLPPRHRGHFSIAKFKVRDEEQPKLEELARAHGGPPRKRADQRARRAEGGEAQQQTAAPPDQARGGKASPYSSAKHAVKSEAPPSTGVEVAKAQGSAPKARGDRRSRATYESGGSVWSVAAKGLRGRKGFAGHYEADGHEEHGEKLDRQAHKGGTEGSRTRSQHSGKVKHQYAKGGRTKRDDDDREARQARQQGGAVMDPMPQPPERFPTSRGSPGPAMPQHPSGPAVHPVMHTSPAPEQLQSQSVPQPSEGSGNFPVDAPSGGDEIPNKRGGRARYVRRR